MFQNCVIHYKPCIKKKKQRYQLKEFVEFCQ